MEAADPANPPSICTAHNDLRVTIDVRGNPREFGRFYFPVRWKKNTFSRMPVTFFKLYLLSSVLTSKLYMVFKLCRCLLLTFNIRLQSPGQKSVDKRVKFNLQL